VQLRLAHASLPHHISAQFNPEYGDRVHLRNIDIHIQDFMLSQPRRPQSKSVALSFRC
jgi:hypothetical protein